MSTAFSFKTTFNQSFFKQLPAGQIDSFRTDFRLKVPADRKIVTCVRKVTDKDGTRIISFSFNPTK